MPQPYNPVGEWTVHHWNEKDRHDTTDIFRRPCQREPLHPNGLSSDSNAYKALLTGVSDHSFPHPSDEALHVQEPQTNSCQYSTANCGYPNLHWSNLYFDKQYCVRIHPDLRD